MLALAAGAVGALALPPFGFFAALFISFTLLVWLLDGAAATPESGLMGRLWPAFLTGWLFGVGYFVAGLWWIGNALLVEADEYAWALPLAVLGLPSFLALFYGLATLLARLFWSDGFGRIAALAAGFGVAEWLRSFVATGFPWNAIGYGAMPVPLMMQSVFVVGLSGMNVLAVLVFAAPALLGTRKGMGVGLGIAAILSLAHLGYGFWRLENAVVESGQGRIVRLVQPAIDQSRKLENRDRKEIFEEHLRLSAFPPADGERRPDIIVWPETSVPFILTQNPDALTRIGEVLEDGQILLTGAVRAEDMVPGSVPRFYNSIYAIDSQGQIISASDKVHLTPFGEYMPFGDVLSEVGIESLVSLPGGFTPAVSRNLLTLPDGSAFYPLICYEAIFPDEISSLAASSTALLNVTNDAWFGATPGPYQHFLQARIRAVENGRPMIRVANNGISAIIDPLGRVVAGLDHNQKGRIDSILGGALAGGVDVDGRRYYFWLIMIAVLAVATGSRARLWSRIN